MANFFDEERIPCACGTELFEEVETYMIVRDDKRQNRKVPYKKYHKCVSCGNLIDISEVK